jgi:hypothetical protein
VTFCAWGQLDEIQSLTEAMCSEGVGVEVNSRGGSLHRWLLWRGTLKNNSTTGFQDSGLLFNLKLLVEHRIQEGEHHRLLN